MFSTCLIFSMRSDELLRITALGLITIAYLGRLFAVGNGPVTILQYEINPFALAVVGIVVLAMPEIIDRVPFGPSRNK